MQPATIMTMMTMMANMMTRPRVGTTGRLELLRKSPPYFSKILGQLDSLTVYPNLKQALKFLRRFRRTAADLGVTLHPRSLCTAMGIFCKSFVPVKREAFAGEGQEISHVETKKMGEKAIIEDEACGYCTDVHNGHHPRSCSTVARFIMLKDRSQKSVGMTLEATANVGFRRTTVREFGSRR